MMNRHKEFYAKHVQHKDEKWKDILHKRFMEAMKSKRTEFIDHLRNIHNSEPRNLTDEILLQEKRELLKSLIADSETEQLDVDSLIELQDRVLDELSTEIDDYLNPEFWINPDNCVENFCHTNDENPVVCPICRNGYLSLSGTVLTCPSCKLNLDTQTDSLNLSTIGDSLSDAEKKHNASGCSDTLHAWLIDQNTQCQSNMQSCSLSEDLISKEMITLLCIGCDTCSFMEVVV
ncbi:unnamed protein product [Trichobilharzia szidati]|nr:unnamed protein product [Trichobilharzia szidati]